MFENIIGQTNTISSLKSDLTTHNFPPAVLFHGPDYCGKLSTALEIARVQNCKAQWDWNCTCHSCEQHRLLIHPNLLLLGTRDFTTEISAAADVLLRTGKISARYFFVRAVRKQLKGFDPVLWEGDAARIKGYQQTIQDIEEEILNFLPEKSIQEEKAAGNSLTRILKLSAKLSGSSKSENIPINQVRNAIFWAHHSAVGGKKIIIIDNADKMLDASRNALLKTLEEPPGDLNIILLTSNKGAIIRTILSRVRPYLFRQRTTEEASEILTKIFREQNPEYRSIREYFLAWKELNPALLKNLAHKFIQFVLDSAPVPDICEEMKELFKAVSPKEALLSFFEELYLFFRQTLLNVQNRDTAKSKGFRHIEKWSGILRDSLYQVEQLNLSPKNTLEYIYLKFRNNL